MDDDDPFYKYDEFGRPLDADTIARRQMLKEWKHMSVDQLRELFISVGTLNPDGSIPEEYFRPSKYRWNE